MDGWHEEGECKNRTYGVGVQSELVVGDLIHALESIDLTSVGPVRCLRPPSGPHGALCTTPEASEIAESRAARASAGVKTRQDKPTPYGTCNISATKTLPTPYESFDEMRMVLRLSLNATVVVLSTFMMALPALLTNASLSDFAALAFRKLYRAAPGQTTRTSR